MGENSKHFRGVFKDGVIVPQPGTALPDGTEVEFAPAPLEFTPEERAEFEAWDRLSDEAWAMIDWGEGEIARDSG